MNTECYVEIPTTSLRRAVSLAYEMSSPQGLGFIHARDGALDEETISSIVGRERLHIAASMDYVHGRACKFTVFREGDRLFVRPRWYDHSQGQLVELLAQLGVEEPAAKIATAEAAQKAENEKWERENAEPEPPK